MKDSLPVLPKILENYPLSDTSVTKEQYPGLPRIERIEVALRHPRHFRMTEADENYLELMQLAYSIMYSCPSPMRARQLIKNIKPGVTLSPGEVLELVASTQAFFVKIEHNNAAFKEMMLEARMYDLYERAKNSGDFKTERLTLRMIMTLQQSKDKGNQGPEIPEMPDIEIVSDIEDAIIESVPKQDDDDDEDDE